MNEDNKKALNWLIEALKHFPAIQRDDENYNSLLKDITDPCNSAKEFIEYFNTADDEKWSDPYLIEEENFSNNPQRHGRIHHEQVRARWYYRGQNNAEFSLLPSAWRPLQKERNFPELYDYLAEGATLRLNIKRYENELVNGSTEQKLHIKKERFKDLLDDERQMLRVYERSLAQAGVPLPWSDEEQREKTKKGGGFKDIVYPYEERKIEWIPARKPTTDFRLEGIDSSRPYFEHRFGKNQTPAIARHQGAPTRLLDWSYRPYHAAYFAGSGFFENEQSLQKLLKPQPYNTGENHPNMDNRIAVWAFHWEATYWIYSYLDSWSFFTGEQGKEALVSLLETSPLFKAAFFGKQLIKAGDRSHEERLLAQDGTFTYAPIPHEYVDLFGQLPDFSSFIFNSFVLHRLKGIYEYIQSGREEIPDGLKFSNIKTPDEYKLLFKDFVKSAAINNYLKRYFKRVTLPYGEVTKLMEFLDSMGVSEQSIMPGKASILKTQKMRALRHISMGIGGAYGIDRKDRNKVSYSLSPELMEIMK